MDCRETERRLHPYLNRELSAEEIIEVEYHLTDCPPCGDRFHFEGSVLRVVREYACRESAPDHLRQSILERISIRSTFRVRRVNQPTE